MLVITTSKCDVIFFFEIVIFLIENMKVALITIQKLMEDL